LIRYISLNAFIAIHSIFFCLWGLFLSLFDKDGSKVHRYCAVPWAKAILWVCGIRVTVFGIERLAAHVPRIYMVNHQSFFDIFILLACLPVDFKFILKQELMRIPLLGPAMRGARYIAIERNDPREAVKSMNQAAKKIKEGTSVLIFPEGTRSVDGRLQAFKKGGFSLAVKAGCDIVPVAIIGSSRIAPKGSLKIRKGTVGMHIGKPIPLGGFGKRDIPRIMEAVRGVMETP
jgi:1-acyl-sn-glycerol-3-phosphate acyltransferase